MRIIIVFLLIMGCGGGSTTYYPEPQPSPPEIQPAGLVWPGGLYDVWPAQGSAYHGVVILHQGHTPFDYETYSLTSFAETLSLIGFEVYGFEMPPTPHGPPIEQYYDYILDFINTIPNGTDIYIIGLSGGGWVATVVTALSNRITKGYSVAGDAPLDIHNIYLDEFEQQNPPLQYRDLYAMASGRLMHIYLSNDQGAALQYTGWTEPELGAPFWVDDTTYHHCISQFEQTNIINDMLYGTPF